MKKLVLIFMSSLLLVFAGCADVDNDSTDDNSSKMVYGGNGPLLDLSSFDFTINQNPIFENHGGEFNTSDPSVCQSDLGIISGIFGTDESWIVCSQDDPDKVSPTNGNYYPMNKTLLFSTDTSNGYDQMKYWGVILEEKDFLKANMGSEYDEWVEQNNYLWAPNMIRTYYNSFYLYVPVMDKNGIQRIAIATSGKPNSGKFTPKMHNVVDDNGNSLENPSYGYVTGLKGRFVNNKWNECAYDPGIFAVGSREVYMTYCNGQYEENGKIRIARMKHGETNGTTWQSYTAADSDTDEPITFSNPEDVLEDTDITYENNESINKLYMEGPEVVVIKFPVVNPSGLPNPTFLLEKYYYLVFAAKAKDGEPEWIGYAIKSEDQFNESYHSGWNFKGWIMKKPSNNDNDFDWTNHASIGQRHGNYYFYYHVGRNKKDSNNKDHRDRKVCRRKIRFDSDHLIVGVSVNNSAENEDLPLIHTTGIASAPAIIPSSYFRIRSAYGNKMLTTVEPNSIEVLSQNNEPSWSSQEWRIELAEGPNGNPNNYVIKNNYTGKYLTVSNDWYGDARKVYCQQRNTTWATQLWILSETNNGSKRFYNEFTNTYLTMNKQEQYSLILAQPLHTDWTSQMWWLDK